MTKNYPNSQEIMSDAFMLLSKKGEEFQKSRDEDSLTGFFESLVRETARLYPYQHLTKNFAPTTTNDNNPLFLSVENNNPESLLSKNQEATPLDDVDFDKETPLWASVILRSLGRSPRDLYVKRDPKLIRLIEELPKLIEDTFSPQQKTCLQALHDRYLNKEQWTYEALASKYKMSESAIKTGVHRVRKKLVASISKFQNRTLAPAHNDIPDDLHAVRALVKDGNIEKASLLLEKIEASSQYEENPFFYLTKGKLFSKQMLYVQAIDQYQKALAYTDNSELRSRACNNWGYVEDALQKEAEAKKDWKEFYHRKNMANIRWQRASELDPNNYVPRFNLLCNASLDKDWSISKHHLKELEKIVSSGKLSDEDAQDLIESLKTDKELDWLQARTDYQKLVKKWERKFFPKRSYQVKAACHPIAVCCTLFTIFALFCSSGVSHASCTQPLFKKEQGTAKILVLGSAKGKKEQRSLPHFFSNNSRRFNNLIAMNPMMKKEQ